MNGKSLGEWIRVRNSAISTFEKLHSISGIPRISKWKFTIGSRNEICTCQVSYQIFILEKCVDDSYIIHINKSLNNDYLKKEIETRPDLAEAKCERVDFRFSQQTRRSLDYESFVPISFALFCCQLKNTYTNMLKIKKIYTYTHRKKLTLS